MRDGVDGLEAHAAAVGDLAGEVLVDLCEHGAERRALLGRERARGRVGERVVAAHGQGLEVDAQPVERPVEHDLAAEHADGAGEGGGVGHDRVGAGGDVVAARGGDGGEARHHGLAFRARALDGVPDLIGRDRRAAGRVDAQHDRAHVVVLGGLDERIGDRVGVEAAGRAEVARLELAREDVALARHDGDHGAMLMRPSGGAQIGEDVHELGVLAGALERGLARLHDVAEHVGEPERDRFLGGVGRALEEVAQAPGR